MTVQECYDAIGGSYSDVIGRLLTDERVIKYVTKFLNNDVMNSLKAAQEAKDYEQIFLHSHNLKGMCLNLGFARLGASSSELCESVRGGTPTQDITPLYEQTQKDYEMTVSQIRKLLGE